MSRDEEGLYNPFNCQSLLGYGRDVHRDSGGVCVYCGFGENHGDNRKTRFDMWRQLTVEHVIPAAQAEGKVLLARLRKKFPHLGESRIGEMAKDIRSKNLRTSCHFCNSATSWWKKQDRAKLLSEFDELFTESHDGPADEWLNKVYRLIDDCFDEKRKRIQWKLRSLKAAFFGTEAEAFWYAKVKKRGAVIDELDSARGDNAVQAVSSPDACGTPPDGVRSRPRAR